MSKQFNAELIGLPFDTDTDGVGLLDFCLDCADDKL